MAKEEKKEENKKELPKNYNFKVDEPRLQQQWLDKGTYKFDPDDVDREIYSIDTPPPTVS